MNAPTNPDTDPLTITALADRIRTRWRMFLPGGAPDAELGALTDTDEASLRALAVMPAINLAGLRAKAGVLSERNLEGGISQGEWALLRSLLSDLARGPSPFALEIRNNANF